MGESNYLERHRAGIAASAGEPVSSANRVVVMVHGRGGDARGMLSLARQLDRPGVAFVAPQASGNTWYPHSFMAPLESNEPWLEWALKAVEGVIEEARGGRLSNENVLLLGFSQGACLVTEYVARAGGRFGGVAALSGGLIGPPGTPRDYGTDLAGTPVFLGCSDIDAHIPVERVNESAEVLAGVGAVVEKRIYPGMGHTINEDELDEVRKMIRDLPARS